MKIERAISVGALAVQEKRKEAAEEAFKQWVAKKVNFEIIIVMLFGMID